jgi:hypothetical protein
MLPSYALRYTYAESRVAKLTQEERYKALDTIHDTSLQNESNPLWWICFDMTEQRLLLEWNDAECSEVNNGADAS